MLERMVGTDRQRIARIAGAFYLVVFVTGAYSAIVRGPAGAVSGLIAGIFYIVVTLLFYDLFKPVNRRLSLVAALFSFAGIIAGPAGVRALNPLVFFGCYCLLIGDLIIRSDFLPSLLG